MIRNKLLTVPLLLFILNLVISLPQKSEAGAITSQIKKLSAQIPSLTLNPAINAYKYLLTGQSYSGSPSSALSPASSSDVSASCVGGFCSSGLQTGHMTSMRGGKSMKFAESLSPTASGLTSQSSSGHILASSPSLGTIKIQSAASILTKSLAPLLAFPKGLKAAIPILNRPIGLKIPKSIPVVASPHQTASESSYSPIFASSPHFVSSFYSQAKPTYNTVSYGGVPTLVSNPFYPASSSLSFNAPFLGEIPQSSGGQSSESAPPSGLESSGDMSDEIGSHLSPSNPEVSYLSNPYRLKSPAVVSSGSSDFHVLDAVDETSFSIGGENFKIPKEFAGVRSRRPKLYTIPKSAIPAGAPKLKYHGTNENGKKIYVLESSEGRKPLNSGRLYGMPKSKLHQTSAEPSQSTPSPSSQSSLRTSGSTRDQTSSSFQPLRPLINYSPFRNQHASSPQLNTATFSHPHHHHQQQQEIRHNRNMHKKLIESGAGMMSLSDDASGSTSDQEGTSGGHHHFLPSSAAGLTSEQMNQLLQTSSSRIPVGHNQYRHPLSSPGYVSTFDAYHRQHHHNSQAQVTPHELPESTYSNSHEAHKPPSGYSVSQPESDHVSYHEQTSPSSGANSNVEYDEKIMYVYVDENGKTVSTKVAESNEGPEAAIPDGYNIANPDAPSVPPSSSSGGTGSAGASPPGIATSSGSSENSNYYHHYRIQHEAGHPQTSSGHQENLVRGPQYQVFSPEHPTSGNQDEPQGGSGIAFASEQENNNNPAGGEVSSDSGGSASDDDSQSGPGGIRESSSASGSSTGENTGAVDMNPGQDERSTSSLPSSSSSGGSSTNTQVDPSSAALHSSRPSVHTSARVTPSSPPHHSLARPQVILNRQPHTILISQSPLSTSYKPSLSNHNQLVAINGNPFIPHHVVRQMSQTPYAALSPAPPSSASTSSPPSPSSPSSPDRPQSMIVSYPNVGSIGSRDLTHYYLVKLKKKLPTSGLSSSSSASASSSSNPSEVPSTSSPSSSSGGSSNNKLINSNNNDQVVVTTLTSDGMSALNVKHENPQKDMVYMLTDYQSLQKPKLLQSPPTPSGPSTGSRPQLYMRVPAGHHSTSGSLSLEYTSEEEALRGDAYSQMLPPGFVPYDPQNPMFEPMRHGNYRLVQVKPTPKVPRSSNGGWIPITDSYKKQQESESLKATTDTSSPVASPLATTESPAKVTLGTQAYHSSSVENHNDGQEEKEISLLNGEDVSNTAYYSGASPSTSSAEDNKDEDEKNESSDAVEGPVVDDNSESHNHGSSSNSDDNNSDDNNDDDVSENESKRSSSQSSSSTSSSSGFKLAAVFDHDFKPVFTEGDSPVDSHHVATKSEKADKSDQIFSTTSPSVGVKQKEEVKVTVSSSTESEPSPSSEGNNNKHREGFNRHKSDKGVFGMRLPPTTSYSMKISTYMSPSAGLSSSGNKKVAESLPTPEALVRHEEDDDYSDELITDDIKKVSSKDVKSTTTSSDISSSPGKDGDKKRQVMKNGDEEKDVSESKISSQKVPPSASSSTVSSSSSVAVDTVPSLLSKPKQYLVPIPGEDGKPKAYVIFSKKS